MIDQLASRLTGVSIETGVPLSAHTSFGIGGPAAGFVVVDEVETFADILRVSRELNIEPLVLGGGTNLLVSDEGFNGLVIKIDFQKLEFHEQTPVVRVGAGVPASRLIEALIDKGYAGLEFAAGLPGTVGGAIAGNAGCFGGTLSDRLVGSTIVDASGRVMNVQDKDWFGFEYRRSNLSSHGAVLVDMVFDLSEGDKNALREKADECLQVRATRHPSKGTKTAGSYFKNLPPLAPGERRRAAGALLDRAGAHGQSVGDAAVFEKHANIIVNRGAATARDVLALAAKMKGLVKEKFDVTLEEEVRFVGERPSGY